MIDFANIALRTVMCLAFLAFVVRPLLMSMIRREPNTLHLEEMAQLAIDSAYKQQFAGFYAPRVPAQKLESDIIDVQAEIVGGTYVSPASHLSEAELAALAQFKIEEQERVKGHEEEMAKRAALAAQEAQRLADIAAERAALEAQLEQDDGSDDSLKKMRENMKKEKKKPTIPAELLAGNSYEDKLMIVRYVTEQEQNRVAGAIRSMIQIQS